MRLRIGAAAAVAAALWANTAAAGPGLGQLTYDSSELWTEIARFDATNGADGGTNCALLVGGYLLLHVAPDSGSPGKSLSIYDVSNPRVPALVASVEDEHTAVLRETHALPIARIAGREYVAFQATAGVQIWDFTDPLVPTFAGEVALEGVDGGDYFEAAWMTSWQGGWLFVGGVSQGIYIVDVHDPTAPTVVKRIGQDEAGGFLVGPTFAMGDRLVVSSTNLVFEQYSIFDIANPADSFLVNTMMGDGGQLYSAIVLGERIYGIGRAEHLTITSFEDDSFKVLADENDMGPASYGSIQDEFLHYGGKEYYQKVDIGDETKPKTVGQVVLTTDDTDHGQAFAFGNLVYIGNDHGTGSVFAVHQLEPDTRPPEVVKFFPGEGENVAPTSRVAVSFSDNLDFSTVGSTTIEVTKDGAIVDGIYSYWLNTVSFEPLTPFEEDATYTLVVKAGGVKDVSGNAVTADAQMTFIGGGYIPGVPTTGAGGAGGFGSGAGSGAGGHGGGPAAAGGDDGGCGCRVPSGSGGPGGATLAAAALALAVLRRRPRSP